MIDFSFLLTSKSVGAANESGDVLPHQDGKTIYESQNTLQPLPDPDPIAANIPRNTREHLALIQRLKDQRQSAFNKYDAEKSRQFARYMRTADDDEIKKSRNAKRILTSEAKKLQLQLESTGTIRWWQFFSKKRRLARISLIRQQLAVMKSEYLVHCNIANSERRADVVKQFDDSSEEIFKTADEQWKRALAAYEVFKKRGSIPLPETDEEEAARRLAKLPVNGAKAASIVSFDCDASANFNGGNGTYGGEIERPRIRINSDRS